MPLALLWGWGLWIRSDGGARQAAAWEAFPQEARIVGCLQGPRLSRESATPSVTAPSGGEGEPGCQALLATSRGHSGTCKLPEPPPQPHRDRHPQRWRVWPGRGPCGRWCWPSGSLPWRWPCWSREREVLVKGSVPTAGNTAPARRAPTQSCTWRVKSSSGGRGQERMPCAPRALTPWEK